MCGKFPDGKNLTNAWHINILVRVERESTEFKSEISNLPCPLIALKNLMRGGGGRRP
jgi:hypothetical protein